RRGCSLGAVRVLVDAGADLNRRDTIYDGTPLGWANYADQQENEGSRAKQYREIAAYLRQRGRGMRRRTERCTLAAAAGGPVVPIVPLLLLLVGAAAGCGGERAPDPEASAPTFRGRVDLAIGEIAGEEPYLFSRVSGIAQDERGRLFVAEWQANEIRTFDPSGDFLFRIGREGEGPGELRAPCCLGFDLEGRLWVRDNGNARYSVFELAGDSARFVTSVRMHHAAGNMWAPLTFDRRGRLIDVGVPAGLGSGIPGVLRLHTTLEGSLDSTVTIESPPPEEVGVHLVDRPTERGAARFFFYQPFGPRHLLAHGPRGAWAEAVSARYVVSLHPGEGAIVTITGPERPGPPLSAREREEAEASMAEDRRRAGVADLPFGIPDRKPPLRGLFFDATGRLWVEREVADGADREADVYAPDGALAGHYVWPAAVGPPPQPAWVGETVLVGVTRDSLDVPRVARVRFEEDPGGGSR
ncbi:MAG: hypothetical protein ACRELC_13170, partial [Gemmatimonadota bacterium]